MSYSVMDLTISCSLWYSLTCDCSGSMGSPAPPSVRPFGYGGYMALDHTSSLLQLSYSFRFHLCFLSTISIPEIPIRQSCKRCSLPEDLLRLGMLQDSLLVTTCSFSGDVELHAGLCISLLCESCPLM